MIEVGGVYNQGGYGNKPKIFISCDKQLSLYVLSSYIVLSVLVWIEINILDPITTIYIKIYHQNILYISFILVLLYTPTGYLVNEFIQMKYHTYV